MCDAHKFYEVEQRVLVFYKYSNEARDCVKVNLLFVLYWGADVSAKKYWGFGFGYKNCWVLGMGIGFGYKIIWVLGMGIGFGNKIIWVLGLGIKFFGFWV